MTKSSLAVEGSGRRHEPRKHEPRVALVTGAARGIGTAVVFRLLSEGYRVIGADADGEALDALTQRLGVGSETWRAEPADVAQEADVQRLMQSIEVHEHGLDVLVNNAGGFMRNRQPLDLDLDRFTALMSNTQSVYLCSLYARPLMVGADAPAIVCLSSISATRGFRYAPGYVASKGAIEALTRSLALDLAPDGIRVNAVAPGMIRTDAWLEVSDEETQRRSSVIPAGRPGEPSEVADLVAFLASPQSAYITGQIVGIDGGLSIQAYTAAFEERLPRD